MTNESNPIVTIGMPLYNNDFSLKQRIESILNQSYQNFILLISDNGSTDRSQQICEEMEKSDNRIQYIRHEKNRGVHWNFIFVLKKAKTKYFVWAAADDIWSQDFIEKNVDILEKNKNVVGSIGEVKLYNRIKDSFTNKIKIKFLENTKKFQYVHPVSGNVEKKIKFYLDKNMGLPIYGIYRTEKLQNANTFEHYKNYSMWMQDLAFVLNVIKEGDFEVQIDTSMYKLVSEKSTSVIQYLRKMNYNYLKILFINFPFTFWCLRNLGIKIFLKNFNYFLKLNLKGEYAIFAELIRICKRIVCGETKYW